MSLLMNALKSLVSRFEAQGRKLAAAGVLMLAGMSAFGAVYVVHDSKLWEYTGSETNNYTIASEVASGRDCTEVTEDSAFPGKVITASDKLIIRSDSTWYLSAYTNNGYIFNMGTLETGGGPYNNNGTLVNDDTGTVTFSNGFVNSSTGTITNNGSMIINSPSSNAGILNNTETWGTPVITINNPLTNTGTINNEGTIDCSSSSISNTGTINNTGSGTINGTVDAGSTDFFWVGGAAGDWNDGDNWASTEGGAGGAGVPGSGAVVTISTASTVTIPLGEAPSIADLTIGADAKLKLTDGNLTISGTISNSGTIILTGDGYPSKMDTAKGTVQYGAAPGDSGSIYNYNTGDTKDYFTLKISAGTWNACPNLYADSITIDSGAVLEMAAAAETGTAITNNGSITVSTAGGAAAFWADIINNGTITVAAGRTLWIAENCTSISGNGSFTSSGNLRFNTLKDKSISKLTIQSGSTFNYNLDSKLTITDFTVNSTTAENSGPNLLTVTNLTLNAGTLSNTGSGKCNVTNLTLTGTGALTAGGTTASPGITVASGNLNSRNLTVNSGFVKFENTTATTGTFTNNGNSTFTGNSTIGSYAGTGKLTVDSTADSIDFTINADSTVANLVLTGSNDISLYTQGNNKNITVTNCNYAAVTSLLLYGNFDIPGGSFKYLSLEEGSVKVNGDITLSDSLIIDGAGQFTGDITADTVRIYDADGSIEMLTAGSTVNVGTKFQNDNSGTFTHNNSTVKFTGATGEVTGNNSFYNLNAAACTTSISFDGDLTVTGTFTAGKVTNLSKNVDFSGAEGFVHSSGTINYYNTSADEVTFKTMTSQLLNIVNTAGNIKFVLNGAVRFSSFKCPARGVKTIGRPWTLYLTRTDSTSSATIVNKCDLENANVNTDATMTGSVVIQAPVTFNNEVVMHVGMQLVVDTDGKVEITHANGLYANTSSATPSMSLTVKGQLKTTVLDLANGNTQYVPVTVESSGKLIAKSITFTSARCTYTDVILTNKGSVEAGSISLPKQIVVNDGTITLKDGAGLTAKKVINSGSDNASGVIECVIDAGDGSETAEIVSSSTTDTSYQKTISADGLNITVKGLWSLDDFTASSNMGDKTVTLNGSSVAVATLSLAGEADHLLNVAGTAAGDGFVFTADQTGGDYLSIDNKILIKDAAADTVAGTHTYTATNSVPADGTTNADKALVIVHGWLIDELKNLTYTWTGTTSTAWNLRTNWDTGIVPVEECSVIIPDSVASNRWPVLTAADTAISIGKLSVGTTASSAAKITLAESSLKATAATDPILNYGTIICTGAGFISDGTDPVNDDANNGTVQYAGTSGGTVADVTYANLVVSASEWTKGEAITVKNNFTVSGGKFTPSAAVTVTGDLTVSGGTYSAAAGVDTSVTGTTTVSGTGQADFGDADGLDSTGAVTIAGGKISGVLKSAASIGVTGAATATGDFTFISDTITVGATVTATNYKATIKPVSLTIPCVFGTRETGKFCLTNTELSRLAAKTVIFGDENNTAGLTINASLSVNSGIHLITGGALTQSTAGSYTINSVAGELYLQAATGIGNISGNAPVTVGSVSDAVSAKITGTGDIYLKISSAATLGGAGSKVILTPNGNIKLETTGKMTLGGDITAANGTLGLKSGGAIEHTAGILSSSSTITLEAAGTIGGITATNTPVEVKRTNASTGVVAKTTGSNAGIYLTENGTLKVLNAGDISATGVTYLRATAFDLAAGAIAAGSGTVTLTGYDSTTPLTLAQDQIDGINTTTSRKLILGDSAHTGGITVSGNVNLSSFTDTTFASKTFTSNSAVISAGKVILLPVENEITLNGGFTFSELEAKNLGGKTIKFAAGTTTNVTDKLTLTGTSKTSRLALRSTTDGSQWTINCTCDSANTDIQFVDVQDSNNTSIYSAAAYDLVAGPLTPVAASYDSGNNDNWSFPGQPYVWKGSAAAGANEWKVKANWEQNSVPSKGGYVSIPSGKTDYPVLTSSIDIGSGTLTVEGTSASVRGQIDLATFDFTAAKITNNGLVRIEGGNTLTVNGVVVSTGSTTALVNAEYSTVEYYGDCRAASPADGTLPWGKSYANLEFTSGAQASLPSTYAITVSGTTLITNGADNEITMEGADRFTGAVTLGDFANTLPAGDITLSGTNTFTGGVTVQTAGDVVLNSSAAIVLADFGTDYSCNSLEITSASTVQNVNTTHAQTFTGAVTLRSDAEFTAGAGEKVWFKSTVTGGNTLANARALTVTTADAEFDGAAGNGTDYIKSISVDGETIIKGVILNVKTSGADGGFMLFKGNVTLDGGDVELKGNTTPCTFEGTVGSNTSDSTLARSLKLTGSNSGMNGVFKANVGGDTNLLKALSVSGTTEFGAAVDSVKTVAEQTYKGDVTFANDLTLTGTSVTFEGNVTGASDLTVNGTVTAVTAGKVFDLRDTANSLYKTVTLNDGFTSGKQAVFVLYGNAVIHGSNDFAQFKVINGDYAAATSVTFDKDSTQTIRNAASATDVYWAGNSETNPLTITGGAAGESWKTVFINKPVAANFSYVIIENSHSVTSAGLANDLKIVPTVANVQDSDNSAYTTKYWFAYDFYWFGKTDTSWYEKSNWSYSPDTYSPALGYPDYQNGTSDLVIVDNDTNELVLENAIDVNSIHVYEGKTIDFATFDVTLTKATDSLDNEGLVRLDGSQTVIAALKNGTDSTVEYYGPCGTVLQLGNTYNNLEFTTGSSADVAAAITVNGTTLFASGTGNNISLTGGNRFVKAVTMGNDADQAGNVTLGGNNTFASEATITIKSADDVVLKGAGIVIKAGAECDSLNVKSAATIGSVTTTGHTADTTTDETQLYEGAVTLSASATFTGTAGDVIHFKDNVTGSTFAFTVSTADGLFGGDISTNAVSIGADCKFDSSSVQNVTTVWGQGYTGTVTISTGISIKAANNVIFNKPVEGPGSLAAEVYGSKPFTAEKTMGAVTPLSSVSIKAGTAVLHGVTTDGTLQITAAPSARNASGVYEWGTSTASNTITLNSGNYISDGNQSLSAAGGVTITEDVDGEWSAGSGEIKLPSTDLFMNYGTNAVVLKSDLTAKNVYFFNGKLSVESGKSLASEKDIAIWGSAYSPDDPRFTGADTRFDYYGTPAAKPASVSAELVSVTGAIFKPAGNFYLNGADISGAKLSIPSNSASKPEFNSTAAVTEKQWGLPYAVAFNSTVADTTVVCSEAGKTAHLAAGATDTVAGGQTQGCTDGAGNTNVQFDVPHIDQAYTVYDDVLYVHFDMPLENSNGEIATNLALFSNDEIAKGGVWYNAASIKYNFSKAYSDPECTTELSATEDKQEFYFRAKDNGDGTFETWNTDADGSSPYNASVNSDDSTDRSGNHKSVTVDVNFLEGLFTAAEGHTMCTNYGVMGASAYTAAEDHTSPVLIAVYTGQELHDSYVQATGTSSQREYDAHNFIEMRYSEAVNLGDLAYNGGDENVRGQSSFDSDTEHGGDIENSETKVVVKGYIEAAGSLNAGVRADCAAGSPHSLYRKFSPKAGEAAAAQTHRVRVSIAGYVDGTVTYSDSTYSGESGTFHRWAGYINSSKTPAGEVTRVANSSIKDIAGNSLAAAGAANHALPALSINGYSDSRIAAADSLYGDWDTIAPGFAPFSTGKAIWDGWWATGAAEYFEIIGSSNGSFLDHVEIHFFDNNRTETPKWPAQWWRTRDGWYEYDGGKMLPDTIGGARPFTNNAASTTGGIRRSTLINASSSFTYRSVTDEVESEEKNFEEEAVSGIRQRMNGAIFRKAIDPNTANDGLYTALPLKSSENLAIRTTFKISYNPESDYITDLAGNRLASSYSGKTTFKSIDLTAPAYTMTLSPVAQNKVYVIFTKRLAAMKPGAFGTEEGEFIDEMTPSDRNTVLEEIKDSFIVCTAKTADSQIGIEKVELVSCDNEYTALLFTLERNITLSDIENLWIRDIGHNNGADFATDTYGEVVVDTKIRDYQGNYLAVNKAHALSDFAINAVDVLYAYGHEKDDDGWDEQGIYGKGIAPASSDYAVHDFSRTQGNYGRLTKGRDITLQVRTIAGVDNDGDYIVPSENFLLMPGKKSALAGDMISDKINKLVKSDWRVWLPTALTSLASRANTNLLAVPASPDTADEGAGLLWNYQFPDADYGFNGGDEIQFVFKVQNGGADILIDHDADDDTIIPSGSPTNKVPLYALTMPEAKIRAGDFSFIDLWSFGIKDITRQRGNVTILNNVINVSNREQTVVEITMPEAGNLNVYVMTLDGNIIKRLAHGRNNAGTHYYKWNGTNGAGNGVARGMYFIRVVGPGIDETRKVMCVKD